MKKTIVVAFILFTSIYAMGKSKSNASSSNGGTRITLKQFCHNHNIEFKKNVLVTSVDNLRLLKNPQENVLYTTTDYGGGQWLYDKNSRDDDNTGTVIGKFKRIMLDNIVKVDWFGAVGDGITDDTKKIQNAVNASRFKTLQFDPNKVYVIGGGLIPGKGGPANTVNIKLGDITIDGNGCKIIPFKKGGGSVFYLYNYDSATGPQSIKNVVIKNFTYDAGYGATIFVNVAGGDNMSITNVSITNNKIYNFSDASNGCIRVSGKRIIKNTSPDGVTSNILINGNSIMDFGKFLNVVLNESYSIGATSLAVSSLYDNESLADQIEIGGYILISSAETKLTKLGTYTGTNSIYKVTGFKPTPGSNSTGTITIASGTYTNANGFNLDSQNNGLGAPVIKNAALQPILAWGCPTLYYWPKFNFTVNSNIAYRSSNTNDENNKANSLYVGAEFYIPGIDGPTYIIKAIDANGNITLNTPFTSSESDQKNRTIIKAGSLGTMIFIMGDAQVIVRGNKLIGGSRGIGGSIPTTVGVGFDQNKSTLVVDGNNLFKNFYMPIEWGNNPFLSANKFKPFSVNQGDSEFTISDASSYKYVKKDINGDGKIENCLVSNNINNKDVSYLNSIIEGNIVSFEGERGIYIIKSIPQNWPQNASITISRYDWTNNHELAGGFIHSMNNLSAMKSYANAPLQIVRQWNTMLIRDNTFEDAHSELLSAGCYNMKIINNIFNGTQNATLELAGENVTLDSNTINNIRWTGQRGRLGVSCGYGVALYGPLSCAVSNLTFTNNTVNTWDDLQNPISGQNSITGIADNPGSLIFKNNVFNGVSGRLFVAQNFVLLNGKQYSQISYYKKFVFENNTVKFNISSDNSPNYLANLWAEDNEFIGNTFTFSNNKSYKIMLANPTPNPIMFPAGTFKTLIKNNASNKQVDWGTGSN